MPEDLSKLLRRLHSLYATQWAPRDTRRDSTVKILYPLTAFTLRCLLFICIIITDVKLQYATWTYLASGAFENLLCSTLPLTQIRRSHG